MKRYGMLSLLAVAGLILAACASTTPEPTAQPTAAPEPTEQPAEEPMEEPQAQTIVDIAVADGRFTTLVAALQAAELVDTLAGEGPFTVFAPTDEAFAALPEGTLEALLADVPQLTDILLYHVVDGKVLAAEVAEIDMATTLQGGSLDFVLNGGLVQIGEAQIILTDIEASNGVIHVIDGVLLPPTG